MVQDHASSLIIKLPCGEWRLLAVSNRKQRPSNRKDHSFGGCARPLGGCTLPDAAQFGAGLRRIFSPPHCCTEVPSRRHRQRLSTIPASDRMLREILSRSAERVLTVVLRTITLRQWPSLHSAFRTAARSLRRPDRKSTRL